MNENFTIYVDSARNQYLEPVDIENAPKGARNALRWKPMFEAYGIAVAKKGSTLFQYACPAEFRHVMVDAICCACRYHTGSESDYFVRIDYLPTEIEAEWYRDFWRRCAAFIATDTTMRIEKPFDFYPIIEDPFEGANPFVPEYFAATSETYALAPKVFAEIPKPSATAAGLKLPTDWLKHVATARVQHVMAAQRSTCQT